MQEIWKDVPNYEGIYQVSNYGNVRSLNYQNSYKTKLLSSYNQGGYLFVSLCSRGTRKNFGIHRLVAIAFIENPQNKEEVNHIDGNKSNNNVYNLEWCTHKENVRHAINTGLRPPNCPHQIKFGKDHPSSKPINQFDIFGNFIKSWGCAKEIEMEFGFKRKFILRCCRKERKTYKGYVWEFAKKGS